MEYKDPFKLDKQLPDLVDIIESLKKAQNKDEKYKDIRPLMYLLNRLENVDARLPSHIRMRKAALMSTDWDISAYETQYQTEVVLIKKRLEKIVKEVIKEFVNTMLFGKFCMQINWETQDWASNGQTQGLWTPLDFTNLEQWDFEANTAYPFNIAYLEHTNSFFNRKNLVESTNISWITGFYRPKFPGGVLRSIIFHEWLLNQDIQDWRNFNKRAKGLAIATHASMGAGSIDAEEKAEEAVKQLGQTSWASVPDTIKFEFLRAVDSVASQTYPSFKEALQADIAIAIRGTANTTQLPESGGSRAAVETLYEVEEALAFMDRNECKDIINQQLLKQDYLRNYATTQDGNIIVPWEFNWLISKREDPEKNARILDILLRNKIPLYTKEVSEKVGFSIATQNEILEGQDTVTNFGF